MTDNSIKDSDIAKNNPETDNDNEKTQKAIKTIQKMSTYDKEAIALVKQNPNLTNYQIGKTLKNLGKSKSDFTIYGRLKQSEYLTLEISKVRAHHAEFLSREILPLALKEHKKALKDKSMTSKDKLPFIQLAEKAEFRYDQPVQLGKISVETMNVIGVHLEEATRPDKGDVHTHEPGWRPGKRREDDVIDVEPLSADDD